MLLTLHLKILRLREDKSLFRSGKCQNKEEKLKLRRSGAVKEQAFRRGLVSPDPGGICPSGSPNPWPMGCVVYLHAFVLCPAECRLHGGKNMYADSREPWRWGHDGRSEKKGSRQCLATEMAHKASLWAAASKWSIPISLWPQLPLTQELIAISLQKLKRV